MICLVWPSQTTALDVRQKFRVKYLILRFIKVKLVGILLERNNKICLGS